jgi:glutathione-regulated potassium-efflux system ancillary protein KefF
MVVVIYAHPYPGRSRSCAALLAAIRDLPELEVRTLSELYPDFDIDVAAEQAALTRAKLVVWLGPVYWYSVPAMMKHWFDVVLLGGWAHGEEGVALKGKEVLWAATTGDVEKYALTGAHAHPFEAFVPVVEQTARYCHMKWLEPFVLHDSLELTDEVLAREGQKLRARIVAHTKNA